MLDVRKIRLTLELRESGIFDTKVLLNNDTKKFLDSEKLILPFKENFLLVNKIQKEGKNLMRIEDFRRGYSKDFEKIKN